MDVNNRFFTFADGQVFDPALTNISTTLTFTNNANNFTLSSAGGIATGTNVFGSCILTVTSSTYLSGAGPQGGAVITLSPCDFVTLIVVITRSALQTLQTRLSLPSRLLP